MYIIYTYIVKHNKYAIDVLCIILCIFSQIYVLYSNFGMLTSTMIVTQIWFKTSLTRCLCLFVGVDTRLKFTIEPSLGKNGFQQVSTLKICFNPPVQFKIQQRATISLTLFTVCCMYTCMYICSNVGVDVIMLDF